MLNDFDKSCMVFPFSWQQVDRYRRSKEETVESATNGSVPWRWKRCRCFLIRTLPSSLLFFWWVCRILSLYFYIVFLFVLYRNIVGFKTGVWNCQLGPGFQRLPFGAQQRATCLRGTHRPIPYICSVPQVGLKICKCYENKLESSNSDIAT